MKKVFYEIIDKKTKKINVGLGNNKDFYKSIGMIECNEDEVEQGCNGAWYLKGYAPQKTLEEQLKELKFQKKLELKQKRDNYLKLKGYNLSDNDKFNIINLLDNYTEEDKNNYINFLNNNLIPKYNTINKAIKEADSIEDVESIAIDFSDDMTDNSNNGNIGNSGNNNIDSNSSISISSSSNNNNSNTNNNSSDIDSNIDSNNNINDTIKNNS